MVDNTRGILAMSAAVVVFIFNDMLIKLAAETVPAAQAIGVRGLFATLWCALALLVTGSWRQMHWAAHPRVLFRSLLEAGALNKAFMASENHRHYPLRKPKSLRKSIDRASCQNSDYWIAGRHQPPAHQHDEFAARWNFDCPNRNATAQNFVTHRQA